MIFFSVWHSPYTKHKDDSNNAYLMGEKYFVGGITEDPLLVFPPSKLKVSRKHPGFECLYCDYCSGKRWIMIRHISARHCDKEISFVDLAIGPKTPEQKSQSLPYYCKTSNPEKWKYRCADCNNGFCSRVNLLRHRKYSCGNTNPKFGCVYCNYRGKRMDAVTSHVRIMHPMEKLTYVEFDVWLVQRDK